VVSLSADSKYRAAPDFAMTHKENNAESIMPKIDRSFAISVDLVVVV